MKKILALVFLCALAGCASKDDSSIILSQSTEEEIMPAPVVSEPYQESTDSLTPPSTIVENRFTIQIVALSSGAGFMQYVNLLPQDIPIWQNEKMVNGAPWSTLLYGEFFSRAEAETALASLPNNVKKYQPFIRSLTAIETNGGTLQRLN